MIKEMHKEVDRKKREKIEDQKARAAIKAQIEVSSGGLRNETKADTLGGQARTSCQGREGEGYPRWRGSPSCRLRTRCCRRKTSDKFGREPSDPFTGPTQLRRRAADQDVPFRIE
jgi:hypothetical protein